MIKLINQLYEYSEVIEKPWGYEMIVQNNNEYVIKILNVSKGQRLSLQYHEKKVETLIMLHGSGFIEVGSEDNQEMCNFKYKSIVHIEPHTVHRIYAGDENLILLEVSTNHLDDVIRLEDDYKRK